MKAKCCYNKDVAGEISKLSEFLKIIVEENRLKILCILKDEEKCVCEIWKNLKLPQNLTSHHLRALSDYGLIRYRKDGLKVFYSLNKKNLKISLKLINKFINK